MNCDRFDERVQQLLDRREDPRDDDELVLHAQQCSVCCESFEAATAMVDFFADCPAHEPVPDGFVDRVLAAVVLDEVPARELGDSASEIGPWLDAVGEATSVATDSGVPYRSPSPNRPPMITWFVAAAASLLAVVLLGAPRSADAPTFASLSRTSRNSQARAIPFVGMQLDRVRVSEWTPVLTTIGDESLEVVRPITDGFSVAYTLLRWHLLGGSGGLPADIRLDQMRDYWS